MENLLTSRFFFFLRIGMNVVKVSCIDYTKKKEWWENMKVAIIGAGAIGMLMGSYIAGAHMDVTMIVRREAQAEQLRQHGITRTSASGEVVQHSVAATTDFTIIEGVDLCIVAVKYGGLKELAPQLTTYFSSIPLLFVQNGLAHVDFIERLPLRHIAFASVEHGALQINDHTVAHRGIGNLMIGWSEQQHHAFKDLEKGSSDSFPITYDYQVQQVLFRKAIINCLINPLTTILQVTNGGLIESPYGERFMRSLYDECMNAFPEMKKRLAYEDVVKVCRNTFDNESSMLTDYKQGRPMEVETIVSSVIGRAKKEGKTLPLLTALEQLLQALNEKA